MPKSTGVGRTNLILVVMGIGACVILSMLMQRSLKIQKSARHGTVVRAVTEVYSSRLRATPEFKVIKRDDQEVGVLTLMPQLPHTAPRLARDAGRVVWEEAPDKFEVLEVVCKRHEKDEGRVFPISRPGTMLPRRGKSTHRKPTRTPAHKPTRKPDQKPLGKPAGSAAKPAPLPRLPGSGTGSRPMPAAPGSGR